MWIVLEILSLFPTEGIFLPVARNVKKGERELDRRENCTTNIQNLKRHCSS
jgi:hypothetical protein